MRVLFWRRKNVRLATRLNAVVQKSDDERKAYRPKARRVVIDTSYLDRPSVGDEDLAAYEAGESHMT